MAMYGYVGLYIVMQGMYGYGELCRYIWLCRIMYCYLWLSMATYAYVGLFMGM